MSDKSDEESKNSSFKTDTSELTDKDSVDTGTEKKESKKEPEMDEEERKKRDDMKDFNAYIHTVSNNHTSHHLFLLI